MPEHSNPETSVVTCDQEWHYRGECEFPDGPCDCPRPREERRGLLTRAQVESKLAELRADRAAWTRLRARWGRLDALQDEIETYEWLIHTEDNDA
jgi:hypothetical protein